MSALNVVFKEYDQCLLEGRFDDAATTIKDILETNKETDSQVYFWALKRFGDYVGYGYLKDYAQAIDIYQTIINEYESEEDDLYEWCQLDIAKSYLNIAINAFQTFDEMTDIIEQVGDERSDYFAKLIEKRNDYIENKAEDIQNARI
jgi:tetratricopeptide (TPR) repeat protein